MEQNWNVGDVVKLKSGGPAMTVEKAEPGRITCLWFNHKDYSFGSILIEAGALAKAEPDERSY